MEALKTVVESPVIMALLAVAVWAIWTVVLAFLRGNDGEHGTREPITSLPVGSGPTAISGSITGGSVKVIGGDEIHGDKAGRDIIKNQFASQSPKPKVFFDHEGVAQFTWVRGGLKTAMPMQPTFI